MKIFVCTRKKEDTRKVVKSVVPIWYKKKLFNIEPKFELKFVLTNSIKLKKLENIFYVYRICNDH